MKKVFTLSLMMVFGALFISQLSAQSQRMGLYEEATQASCPPCAGFNPGFQEFLNANHDDAVFISYQVWWPGFDPMYNDNPGEVDVRIGDYYPTVNGAPGIVFQGSDVGQTYNSSQLEAVNNQMSEFDIVLAAEVSLEGMLTVTGSVTATMAASGDFKLRIALTEDLIHYADAPGGTNGETEYHHVFKKFLGGPEGLDLADDWAEGDTFEINETLDLNSLTIYTLSTIEIIAFVQNDDDKFVHQAAKIDNEIVFDIATVNGASLIDVGGVDEVFCAGEQLIYPVVTIENGGNDNLTSLDIIYTLDDGETQTFNWTGDLITYAQEEVTIGPIAYTPSLETSVLNFEVANPNNGVDETVGDDAGAISLSGTPTYSALIEVNILTDDYGEETYWEITDESGTAIASGGNVNVAAGLPGNGAGTYESATLYTEEVSIPADGCYSFRILDAYGDGICCAWGNGYYELNDADGNILISGGQFTSVNDELFNGLEMLVNTNDPVFASQFTVSPNPVVDLAQLAFTLETSAVTTITVVNNLGQVVSQENLGKISAGEYNHNIDMSDLAAGVYMIHITSGDIAGTKKVIVGSRF